MVVFDHAAGTVYLLCLGPPAPDRQTREWLGRTTRRLTELAREPPARVEDPRLSPQALRPEVIVSGRTAWRQRHPPERYLELIETCRREIRAGESYADQGNEATGLDSHRGRAVEP
jgi:para-aminobenzoate synthetase